MLEYLLLNFSIKYYYYFTYLLVDILSFLQFLTKIPSLAILLIWNIYSTEFVNINFTDPIVDQKFVWIGTPFTFVSTTVKKYKLFVPSFIIPMM